MLGSGEAWRTLLQTLRTRIFLSLSDEASAEMASKLCGQVAKIKSSYTINESAKSSGINLMSAQAGGGRGSVGASKSFREHHTRPSYSRPTADYRRPSADYTRPTVNSSHTHQYSDHIRGVATRDSGLVQTGSASDTATTRTSGGQSRGATVSGGGVTLEGGGISGGGVTISGGGASTSISGGSVSGGGASNQPQPAPYIQLLGCLSP